VTIIVEITPEVKAALVLQAAEQGRDVEVYAASLLEQAAHLPSTSKTKRQRPSGRTSLAQLFAESPFKGLDLAFERDQDLS
jgi:hypothetical protein